ncbi:MAG: DUF4340 domain-containing protein [Oscillospiraceae bacterium]|nr:DUF4340 domain-containing protein [Oscillospiraceae bacterium]
MDNIDNQEDHGQEQEQNENNSSQENSENIESKDLVQIVEGKENSEIELFHENPYYEKPKKKNLLNKQIIIVIVCIIVVGALSTAYFATLKPIENNAIAAQSTTEGYTLMPGESMGPGKTNRIFITDPVDKKDTKSVYVKNHVDEYTVIHHLGQDIFYVEGAELAPVNPETLSSFYTNVGYLLSMTRVAAKGIDDDADEIFSDLTQFGFNDDCAYFVVTKTDDTWYKIIIGDKIPTTGGYYVMYEDANGRRPAIYIIDTTMEGDVLATRYALLQAIVCKPIGMNATYLIDNFDYYKGADKFVEIYNAPIPEGSEVLVNRQMRYPAPYTVSDNYSTLLNTFTNFAGTQVVYNFPLDQDIDENILVKYGFDQYTAKITFDYNGESYYFLFSKPNDAGNYYVISMEFGTIVEVTPDTVPFLTWGLLKFVDPPIFSENINDVAGITVKVPGKPDAVFTIDGTGQNITVYANGTALDFPNPDTSRGTATDKAWNFRQYYKSILSINLWDYQEDVSNGEDPLLEMDILMKNGDINIYKFYFVVTDTRHCFFTINGSGEFYVLKDKVTKLIADTDLVMQNQLINSDAAE